MVLVYCYYLNTQNGRFVPIESNIMISRKGTLYAPLKNGYKINQV